MQSLRQRKPYVKRTLAKEKILNCIKISSKNYGQLMNETGLPRSSMAGTLSELEKEGKIRKLDSNNLEERRRFGVKNMDKRQTFYILAEDASSYAIQTEIISKISEFLESLDYGKCKNELNLTNKQIQIYVRELIESLSSRLYGMLDDSNLFKLYKIAEEGKDLINDDEVRTQLLHTVLETLVWRTANSDAFGNELSEYVISQTAKHLFSLINSRDSKDSVFEVMTISKLLLILGNRIYPSLESIVCFILSIDDKDSGGLAPTSVLNIPAEERDKIDRKKIYELIQQTCHYGGNQFSPYLNQLIKNNIDRMFRKEVKVADSDPELAKTLKQIRDMAKNMPLRRG